MKKWGILAVLGLTSVSAWADGNTQAFSGVQVGVNGGATKYIETGNSHPLSVKLLGDVDVVGGYGFDYGQSGLVGEVQGKFRMAQRKFVNTNKEHDVRERIRYGVGYAQGYRFTKDLMPYVKAQYLESHMQDRQDNEKENHVFRGYGVGVGAKYAITPNIEAGVEYMHSRIRSKDKETGEVGKLKGHGMNAGVSYRF